MAEYNAQKNEKEDPLGPGAGGEDHTSGTKIAEFNTQPRLWPLPGSRPNGRFAKALSLIAVLAISRES